MDEYDYLEAQLEAPAPAQEQQLPGPPPVEDKPHENGHRSSSRGDGSSRRDRSKDRRRSRSRGDRRRSRERSRDRKRSRSRDRRDKAERYGGSRGGPDRDRRRDEGRPMERGKERGRDRERPEFGVPPARRDRTPPEVRLQREKEQELKDLERTVRTVMVMNLNLRALEKDIFDFFVQVGPINDIKLICDKNTRKSKGIAYIEFGTVEAAISALTCNGQIMMGMPVLVKPSEAEKNLAWEAQQQAKQNQASAMSLLNKMGGTAPGVKANPIKLQILNLHPDIGEDDMKDLFAPFGEINYVKVVRDPAGISTGEGYIQYADEPMANSAIRHFNGFELAGKKLTVQVAPLFTPALLPPIPGVVPIVGGAPAVPPLPGAMPGALPGPPPLPPGMGIPGLPGATVPSGLPPMPTLPPPPGLPGSEQVAAAAGEVDDLDEAENRSFKLNAQSRAALMSRLATSAGLQAPPSFLNQAAPSAPAAAPAAPAGPVLQVPQHVLLDQGLLGPASPIPTPCLLLKNMFSDADKQEANWEVEVAEDVRSEATKFGQVLHCHLNPNSQGHVYLKFAAPEQADAAYRALHGRYYAGNQIVASFQFLQPYNNYFGLR